MKRVIKFFTAIFILTCGMNLSSFAQDDVYYDPNKDQGYQAAPAAPQSNESNNYQSTPQPNDRTDGYSTGNDNPAYNYDTPSTSRSTDPNGNTYITNNYYDQDDYGYTTQLRRYYTPNYGVGYYNYCFTPSYYLGWNSWNSPYMVSVNPWYSDPWWGWNRRHRFGGYDPFYDPYWNWNFGWNSFSYYNSWNAPYWGYNSCYYGYNNWGYNGYGGYCGGYGGYYNRYNHGYYNGYHDGYGNGSGYNNGYFYNGPRHRSAVVGGGESSGTASNPVTPFHHELPKTYQQGGKTNINMRNVDVPKEGIQKPFTSAVGINKNNDVNIKSNSTDPYNTNNPNVVGKSSSGNIEKWNEGAKPNMNTNENIRQVPNTIDNNTPSNSKYGETKTYQPKQEQQARPQVNQNNNGWTETPPSGWGQQQRGNANRNDQPAQNNQRQIEQQQQRQNNNWNQQQRNMEQRQAQPRENMQEQHRMEQPQNMEQRRMEQPRNYNSQPRSDFHQSAPQQRSFSSSPSHSFGGGGGGGGGFRGGRR